MGSSKVKKFLVGLLLITLGVVLVTMNTKVSFNLFSLHYRGLQLSSGLLVIPLFISVIMLMAMKAKWVGWTVFWASLATLLIALILSVRISLVTMSLFTLLLMFAPVVFGVGLVFSSFFGHSEKGED